MNTSYEISWVKDAFQSCIGKPVRQKRKIFAREYLKEGKYPVVDQGQDFISGWTNDDDVLIQDDLPLIIFGDHTRIFKFIDFPFAAGADGTQILKPREDIAPSFFYYRCLAIDIPSKGYSRHFKILKENEFTYPVSKSEQLRIAAILHKIRKAIEVENKLIQTTRELKKSTMKQLFTHGLRGEKLKETEIGLVPESWEIKILNDIFENHDGKRIPVKQSDRKIGEYPYYGASGIVDRVDNYLFDGDYLLVAEDGENLATRKLPIAFIASGKFWVNNHAHALKIIKGNIKFFEQFISQMDIKDYLTGTTRPKLNKGLLMQIKVPYPKENHQQEIAHILQTIDQKIETHEKKKSTLQDLFKTMLHKLMTAEICVHDLEIDTSEVV